MTSQKQNEANRRNSLLSTGPRTAEGKEHSRQNAYRHGLTAETVLPGIENASEYAAFETAIVTDYSPQSVVERELTLRLASLLWRLRRAGLIETGLLHIPGELSSDKNQMHPHRKSDARLLSSAINFISAHANDAHNDHLGQTASAGTTNEQKSDANSAAIPTDAEKRQTRLTRSFLLLSDMPGAPLERLGRYEASLWRQFVQTLFALEEAKRHRLVASRRRFTPYPPQW
jgi:hypothetical protein